jgi:nucleoside-diphosphate-sugar epimerase
MTTQKTALVLGATGGVGGAIAAALVRHGWQVRAMARDLSKTVGAPQIIWVKGDAMQQNDVINAAQGASIIVHAVNPAGYRNWDSLVLPMIDNTIAAARSLGGVRVVLPGTIYNFDPTQTPVVLADTPQTAPSRKGKIRIALEARLAAAAPQVPSLIVRSGDFFGPGARSSWFSQAMVTAGKPVRRIINPARGAGHTWAYLPDLAEAFVQLLAQPDTLLPFEQVQFGGLYDASGSEMTDALRRVTGRNLRIHVLPWWLLRCLAPLGGFAFEAAEIAPYWRNPMRLDNSRLVQLLGAEPRTDLDVAVRRALCNLGCLATPIDAPLVA